MIDAVLQVGGSLFSTVAFLLRLLTTVLGLVVAYIAFRGYRRNQSRPMLFVAVGFVFVFWTPVLLLLSFLVLPEIARIAPDLLGFVDFVFGVMGSVSQVIGLLCILYGLRMPRRR